MGPAIARHKDVIQRRGTAIICAVLAFCLLAKAQDENSDFKHAKDEFMAKVFTKCNDDTYFFGPRETSNADCPNVNPTNRANTARQVMDCAELIEFKGVRFPHDGFLGVDPLNTDLAAGIEKKVLFIIDYDSYVSAMRVTDRPLMDSMSPLRTHWIPWERPVINSTSSMSQAVSENRLPPGTKAIGIGIKKGGQWKFYPGPDFPTLVSAHTIGRATGLDIGQLFESITDSARSFGPGADTLPGMLPTLNANVIEKIASQKPASCSDVPGEFANSRMTSNIARAAPVVPPTANPLPNVDHPPIPLPPSSFIGTAEQFAEAFPHDVQKAAQIAGVDAQDFSEESAFIIDLVRRCAHVTPATSAQIYRARPGEKYYGCSSGQVNVPVNASHPDIRFMVAMLADYANGKGFSMRVSFTKREQHRLQVVVDANIPGRG